jgi:hypothetical protein
MNTVSSFQILLTACSKDNLNFKGTTKFRVNQTGIAVINFNSGAKTKRNLKN